MRHFHSFLKRSRRDDGFTLIEVLVSILIMGLIASIAVPIYLNQKKSVTNDVNDSYIQMYGQQLSQARVGNNGRYPQIAPDASAEGIKSRTYDLSSDLKEYCMTITLTDNTVKYLYGGRDGSFKVLDTACSITTDQKSPITLGGELLQENKVVLSWNDLRSTDDSIPSDSTGFTYGVFENGTQIGTTNEAFYNVPNSIEQETKYFVKVLSFNGTPVEREPSNTVVMKPNGVKPTTAPILSMTQVTTDEENSYGTLTWNPVMYARSYELYNAETGEVLWTGFRNDFQISAPVGGSISVYLIASNSFGSSPRSNIVILAGPVVGQTVLQATEVDHNATGYSIQPTWTFPRGAKSYSLFINDELVHENATIGMKVPVKWNTGPKNVKVIPYNAAGEPGSESNTLVFDTTQAIPQPITPTITSLSYNQIAVKLPAPPAYAREVVWEVGHLSGSGTSNFTKVSSGTVPYPENGYIYIPVTAYDGDTWAVWVKSKGWMGESASMSASRKLPNVKPTLGSWSTDYTKGVIPVTCSAGNTPKVTAEYYDNDYNARTSTTVTGPSGNNYTIATTQQYSIQRALIAYAKCVNNRHTISESSTESSAIRLPWRPIPAPSTPSIAMWHSGTTSASGHAIYSNMTVSTGCVAGSQLVYNYNNTARGSGTAQTAINGNPSGTLVSAWAPSSNTYAFYTSAQAWCQAGSNASGKTSWASQQISLPIPYIANNINMGFSYGLTTGAQKNPNYIKVRVAWKSTANNYSCNADTDVHAGFYVRAAGAGSGYNIVRDFWWAVPNDLNGTNNVYTDRSLAERYRITLRCSVKASNGSVVENGVHENYYFYDEGSVFKDS